MKQTGFTLIEIMIAVAVVGILAALGQPLYRKYKAQSVMAQAKTELSQIYTAEKTFKEEYRSFHWHLPAIGFVPAQIDAAVADYPAITDADRYYGVSITTQGTVSPALATFGIAAPGNLSYDHTIGFRSGRNYCDAAKNSVQSSETAAFGANLSAMTATTFKAVAVGCPLKWEAVGSTNLDRWTIDQDLNMLHVNQQN